MQEWDIDLSEVQGLRNWYKKQPRKMLTAEIRMLNDFAFGTRTEAIAQIGRVMTVRSPVFVASRMRVTKATETSRVAITGSVYADRFTGWREQEKGTPTVHPRFATLAGRGGSKDKTIRPSMRLKRSNEMITIADMTPKGGANNIAGFFAMLIRKKENRLVRVKGAVYKRKGKQFQRVQILRPKQPKLIHWLRDARALYFRGTNLDKMWAAHCNRLMTPPPKK